jgi:hypothetical protein
MRILGYDINDADQVDELRKERDKYQRMYKKAMKRSINSPAQNIQSTTKGGAAQFYRFPARLEALEHFRLASDLLRNITQTVKFEVFRPGFERNVAAEADEIDENEAQRLDEFMTRANSNNQGFLEVLRSFEDQLNTYDDGVIFLNKTYTWDGTDVITSKLDEAITLNPAYLGLIMDDRGRLGYNDAGEKVYTPLNDRTIRLEGEEARQEWEEKFEEPTVRACYAYKNHGVDNADAYYYDDNEIIHKTKYTESLTRGTSPIVSVFDKAQALVLMDEYIKEYYEQGKNPNAILAFKTENEESLETTWEEFLEKHQENPHAIHPLAVDTDAAGEAMSYVDMMNTLEDMQYTATRNEFRKQVGALFYVSPIFMNDQSTSGGLNNEGLQITVTNRGIEMGQRIYNQTGGVLDRVLDALNISTIELRIRPNEERDEAHEQELLAKKLSNAEKAVRLGLDARYTEDDDIEIDAGNVEEPSPDVDANALIDEPVDDDDDDGGGGGRGPETPQPPETAEADDKSNEDADTTNKDQVNRGEGRPSSNEDKDASNTEDVAKPFSGFDNFDDCVQTMREDEGHDMESATRICGALQAEEKTKAEVADDLFTTQEEALERAGELGISGTHTHTVGDDTFFMPGETHDEYWIATDQKHAAYDATTPTVEIQRELSEEDRKPNEGMKEAARTALRMAERHDWEKTSDNSPGTRVGWERANQIDNNESLSRETWQRMNSFFARHGDNALTVDDDLEPHEDHGYVAGLLWGGEPGKEKAERVVEEIEDERDKIHSFEAVDVDAGQVRKDLQGELTGLVAEFLDRYDERRPTKDELESLADNAQRELTDSVERIVEGNLKSVYDEFKQDVADGLDGAELNNTADELNIKDILGNPAMNNAFEDLGEDVSSKIKGIINDLYRGDDAGSVDIEDVKSRIQDVVDVANTRAENIARTETAKVEAKARRQAYEEAEESRDEEFLYEHIGPDDRRTTDTSKRIKDRTQGGVPWSEYVDIVTEESNKDFPEFRVDPDAPASHYQTRHTFIRVQ